MEIEKKYLVDTLPFEPERFPKHEIEQAYICKAPTLRIRKKDDAFIFTYKNRIKTDKQLNISDEVECDLDQKTYEHLLAKADGKVIKKTRYLVPYDGYTIELDIFHGDHEGLMLAEVEFENEEDVTYFIKPYWFGDDVSGQYKYTNSYLAYSDDADIN
ncbi:MAG: CYTH domain-containing protein [Eubacterium sp.]|nr:CYTH domain-containing protein [Eubacterium sp.]